MSKSGLPHCQISIQIWTFSRIRALALCPLTDNCTEFRPFDPRWISRISTLPIHLCQINQSIFILKSLAAASIALKKMSFPPESIAETVKEIAEILKRRKETISVSEAACGGLLSAYLVSVPGASNWFHGGTLVYSLKSRLKLSGWSQEDINNYTGPSEKVVLKLARNLRVDLGSTYVLSETGIAGPLIENNKHTESQLLFADKDIGTVYLGVSTPSGEKSKVYKSGNNADRSFNMQEFARVGLEFFLEELKRIENEEKVGEANKDGELEENDRKKLKV